MNGYIIIKISKERLTAVYLRKNKGKIQAVDLLDAQITGLPDEEIAGLIRKFTAKNSARKPIVISVFPSNYIIPKNIEIPSVDEKEIEEVINLQATRHTPYSRNEIVIDYSVAGVFQGRYSKVILAIAKKEIIEKQLAILRLAKCGPEKIVLEAESVAGWCLKNLPDLPEEKPVAVIHVDVINIDFIVIYRQKIIYIRSLPVNKKELFSGDGQAKEKFLDELLKSLEAYNAENIAQVPAVLYFTGIVDGFSDFIEMTGKETKIETKLFSYLESFNVLSLPAKIKESGRNISVFSLLAVPLVLDSLKLNLMPENVKIEKEIQEKAKNITKIGVFIIVIVVIFISLLFTDFFFKNLYLDKLNERYIEENKKASVLKDISSQTGAVKQFISKKGKVLHFLTELIDVVPDEIYFNSINLRQDGVLVVTSTADAMSRVFSLVPELEKNKNFKDVKVDFTRSRVVGGKDIADFGITMVLSEEGFD